MHACRTDSLPAGRHFANLWLDGQLTPIANLDQPATQRDRISGNVVVNGLPLPLGLISFCRIDAPRDPVVVASIRDGFYQLELPAAHRMATCTVVIESVCTGCDCFTDSCVPPTQGSDKYLPQSVQLPRTLPCSNRTTVTERVVIQTAVKLDRHQFDFSAALPPGDTNHQ